MIRFPASASCWLTACALIFAARSSHAFAVFTVGADAACSHHVIQDAIDAAAAEDGPSTIFIASNQAYVGQHLVVADQD